jgi:hypothetical protein
VHFPVDRKIVCTNKILSTHLSANQTIYRKPTRHLPPIRLTLLLASAGSHICQQKRAESEIINNLNDNSGWAKNIFNGPVMRIFNFLPWLPRSLVICVSINDFISKCFIRIDLGESIFITARSIQQGALGRINYGLWTDVFICGHFILRFRIR